MLGHEALKLGVRSGKVLLHCCSSPFGVAGTDCVKDELVRIKTGFAEKLKTEKVDQIEHSGTRILDCLGEKGVASGIRHSQMEEGVRKARLVNVAGRVKIALRTDHGFEIGFSVLHRRQSAGGTLNDDAEVCQLQNGFGAVEHFSANFGWINGCLSHDWPPSGAPMNRHVAAGLQNPQRLSQRLACNPQLFGEFTFRGQAVTRLNSAKSNLAPEVVDDGVVAISAPHRQC